MKCKFLFLIIVVFMTAKSVMAAVSDFADYFDKDIAKDKLPTMAELEASVKKIDNYNRKYSSFSDLLGDFDDEFYYQTATYGMQEKRIKGPEEDLYLEFLSKIPKKYYQYLGPQLFMVPNMSEKVLNLPGIRETKNQFPKRLAKQVEDIKDLEFVSPYLYFLLMPEAWSGYDDHVEYPKTVKYSPKVVHNKEFFENIKKLVKPEKFMPGAVVEDKKSKSDLRNLKPEKNSLLTAADVAAFIATIDDVSDWAADFENKVVLSKVTILWNNWEREDEIGRFVPSGLMDLVHPCYRLAQKARIGGKERELAALVAKEGFSLNEWVYTCDKTIKAYRVANVRSDVVGALGQFKKGVFDNQTFGLGDYTLNVRFAIMQAILQAHKAPLNDVIEYKKNRKNFEEKLQKYKYKLFGDLIMTF